MAALVPVIATRGAGANMTTAMTAATAGPDTFPAGPNTFLRVKSTNAGTVAVTVTPPASTGQGGTTISPVVLAPVVEVTTGDRIYGPFPQNPFGDASGNVNIACVPFASVTIGAFVLPGGA
jgi:hypothetical protein